VVFKTAVAWLPLDNRDYLSRPISGTDRLRQIFLASRFEISVWRGMASMAPL
jgi:hypothetical protein